MQRHYIGGFDSPTLPAGVSSRPWRWRGSHFGGSISHGEDSWMPQQKQGVNFFATIIICGRQMSQVHYILHEEALLFSSALLQTDGYRNKKPALSWLSCQVFCTAGQCLHIVFSLSALDNSIPYINHLHWCQKALWFFLDCCRLI